MPKSRFLTWNFWSVMLGGGPVPIVCSRIRLYTWSYVLVVLVVVVALVVLVVVVILISLLESRRGKLNTYELNT